MRRAQKAQRSACLSIWRQGSLALQSPAPPQRLSTSTRLTRTRSPRARQRPRPSLRKCRHQLSLRTRRWNRRLPLSTVLPRARRSELASRTPTVKTRRSCTRSSPRAAAAAARPRRLHPPPPPPPPRNRNRAPVLARATPARPRRSAGRSHPERRPRGATRITSRMT